MTTLREETIAKEIFAEFIFTIYHLNRKNFFRKFSKLVNRENFLRKTFLNSVNRKNLILKNIQNWSTAKTNSAFLLKKPEQLRGQLKDIQISLQIMIK